MYQQYFDTGNLNNFLSGDQISLDDIQNDALKTRKEAESIDNNSLKENTKIKPRNNIFRKKVKQKIIHLVWKFDQLRMAFK